MNEFGHGHADGCTKRSSHTLLPTAHISMSKIFRKVRKIPFCTRGPMTNCILEENRRARKKHSRVRSKRRPSALIFERGLSGIIHEASHDECEVSRHARLRLSRREQPIKRAFAVALDSLQIPRNLIILASFFEMLIDGCTQLKQINQYFSRLETNRWIRLVLCRIITDILAKDTQFGPGVHVQSFKQAANATHEQHAFGVKTVLF